MGTEWDVISTLGASPVNWESVCGRTSGDLESLYYEWAWVYGQEAVGIEDRSFVEERVNHVVHGFSLESDVVAPGDPNELRNLRMCLQERVPRATDRYMDGIGRLASIKFLRPSEHEGGKHAPKGRSRSMVISGSSDGSSRFFRDVDGSELKALFWDWFSNTLLPPGLDPESAWSSDFPRMISDSPPDQSNNDQARTAIWHQMRCQDHIRISVDCLTNVGGSVGDEVTFVIFDINLGASVAHAFPVTADKAAEVHGGFDLGTSDLLQGYF